ncbi:hypothetical protein FACS1894116_07870 [Betaproteobacteria bacterium]|nr:hypothetical protein FACS1894116_07870 [Betaproteobacteria bacterium]GHT97841.1 hypothetical protein FACS1894154_02120 [Betaproteobacteria bacterium]GHU30179.1 hypothetical protein FACS189497_09530 [Betaproteobacteria bacterium]
MSEARPASHTCPSCAAAVSAAALACGSCDAVFSGPESWKPVPPRIPAPSSNNDGNADNGAGSPLTLALGVLAFIVYGVTNLFVMMWVGFGGASQLTNALGAFVYLLYPLLCLVGIYIPLIKAPTAVRNSARYALLVPWGLILIIAIPQIAGNAGEVLLLCLVAAAIWYLYIPGEALVRWITGNEKNA